MGPIQKLKLLRVASNYIDLWSKWSKNGMLTNTSKTTKIFQILSLIGTGLATFGGFIPVAYIPWVAIGISTIQAIQAQIAHQSNPDGTAAVRSK